MLKNALDLMGFEEFEGKMLGLVGVSGGGMGAYDALNTLRQIGLAVARFARLHKCEQALDFLRNWEKAHGNPGGK